MKYSPHEKRLYCDELSVADPGFPGVGTSKVKMPTYYSAIVFSQKLQEIGQGTPPYLPFGSINGCDEPLLCVNFYFLNGLPNLFSMK